ncbi:Ribosomal RNA small subunit methyltransferase E [Rubripirellula lacrimiformis]|uniref:Ribosomal RNA small subunit methyltransferase E n=1 Tax=Rubripirellula lacrimiformis TaxID=1930273 RepID=A0A517NBQ6_9BACT|nr:RsmE family RNA methyltransferase [Rubripirellula lacrimiformis]QDT04574.1 Ribosomal RNA small subunit methyltransferase E [Rubripirellula lacrimiformis]
MTRRYFVPELPLSGGLVALPNEEAQHATRVMRVKIGDDVTLFDGRGHEAEASVLSVGRNECQCTAQTAAAIDREPKCRVHLGVALPKPDRARELIERLTELGVASLTPITAGRTQRGPSESLIEKMRRGVIESCKQSGRNQLLEVRDPIKAADYFRTVDQATKLIAHPTESVYSLDEAKLQSDVAIAIGPEGGWTDDEVSDAVAAGFRGVTLGPRIYRIETAAAVIAAVLVT